MVYYKTSFSKLILSRHIF